MNMGKTKVKMLQIPEIKSWKFSSNEKNKYLHNQAEMQFLLGFFFKTIATSEQFPLCEGSISLRGNSQSENAKAQTSLVKILLKSGMCRRSSSLFHVDI